MFGISIALSGSVAACASSDPIQEEPEETVESTEEALSKSTKEAVAACAKHALFLVSALALDPDYDDGPAARRGRRAFNDRQLHGLGGNGRACADCHMGSDHYQLSPANAKARYEALQGCRKLLPFADDPLFRPIDADDFRTNGDNASDFSNLIENGLVRITFPLPPNVRLIDPATNAPSDETVADVWRAVPTVENVAITGPDGLAPVWPRGPNQQGGYQLDARVDTLQNQALGAFRSHAEIQNDPSQGVLDDLAVFQNGIFSSKRVEKYAEALLAGNPPPNPDPPLNALETQGKAVFERACATCHGGPGGSTTFTPPPPFAPVPRYHDIATQCPRPVDTVSPPRFVFPACPPSIARNARTYEFTQPDGTKIRRTSTDPGRALLTGNVGGPAPLDDWQKFDTPQLRGISKTAPYFHNNSAATLEEVLDLYDAFFARVRANNPQSPLLSTAPDLFDRPPTPAERPALLAYLRKL